jgi:hypothetical protein
LPASTALISHAPSPPASSRIAAHAAAEAEAEGRKRVTPFWRTLKSGGEVNPKYPGVVDAVAKRLRAEGHRIIQKGKRTLVAGYEQRLFTRLMA